RLKSYCHTAGNLNRIKIGMGFSGRLLLNSLYPHSLKIKKIAFYLAKRCLQNRWLFSAEKAADT
ncbi:hypothetical protein, partial [Acinetobacter baumannii]|uniref:hypothetical protein n=1 Tax=Acinetobacter baumannii TaxID=470 RepID=UPI001BC88DFD